MQKIFWQTSIAQSNFLFLIPKTRPSFFGTGHHKWELRAWPAIKLHRSDLNCLSSLMAGVLQGMKDESGYKSFFEEAEHEMKWDAVGPHVR